MRAEGTAQAEPEIAAGRFRDVLRIRTFLVMYLAEAQSNIGDQLARVALSALVYARTGSAAETALAYALTLLPAIVGGGVLSGLADRYSRRQVMVLVDLSRAILVGCMALPGMPTVGLFALLAVAVFLGPAFLSAEVSLIAAILDAEHYRIATGLRMITNQLTQVAGFAVGGALVALLMPRWVLGIDALSFAASSLIIAVGLRRIAKTAVGRHRRPENPEQTEPLSLGAGIRALWTDRHVRALIGLSWLAAFFIAPEGLAAPYAKAIGGGNVALGILLAAIPFGSVIGAFVVLRRIRPELRMRLVTPMAVLAGIPLIGCVASPPLAVSLVLWTLSGVFAAYQLDAITAVVQAIPDAWRGRGIGLYGAGLTAVQGLGLIVFGIVAQATNAGRAIALAGLVGSSLALVMWIPLARQSPKRRPSGTRTASAQLADSR